MDALGQFEQLVLTAILALGDNAYGVTIHAKVEELSQPRKIARGAIYATLDRMEDKGLIASPGSSAPTPMSVDACAGTTGWKSRARRRCARRPSRPNA